MVFIVKVMLAPAGGPAIGTGAGSATRCWVAIGKFMVMVLDLHNCGDRSLAGAIVLYSLV